MSRIDDALTRLTGKPAETPRPAVSRWFASEKKTERTMEVRGDERSYPSVSAAARQAIEKRLEDSQAAAGGPQREPDLDPTENLFSLSQVLHYVGFGGRAVVRHRWLVVVLFLLTFAMIVTATKLAPRSYEIEVKMLAQRSALMQSLSNPGRSVPYDVDAPTRAAAEIVLRHDTLISLIRQNNLIDAWDQSRAPILRLYDRAKAKIVGREPTVDEKLDALIKEIENRMQVSAAPSTDGVVTIYVSWPDSYSGYLLVQGAQQAFLDARQIAETQAIAEAIVVLERYTDTLKKDLQTTLAELGRTHGQVLAELAVTRRPRRSSGGMTSLLDAASPLVADDPIVTLLDEPTALAGPRLDRLRGTIAGKRSELSRLEFEQKQKLNELQAQLSVARTIYTPNHPTVQSLQQNISALQHNSPRIMSLRTDVDRLELEADEAAALAAEQLLQSEMIKRGPTPPRPRPRVAPLVPVVAQSPDPQTVTDGDGVPRPTAVAEFATLSLRTQLNQLRSILERSDAARIEFEVAKAAFKYRYTTVSPAAEPSGPTFPDTRHVIAVGVFASLLFALCAAIAFDVLSRRVMEPWQVQRQLGLPLLGSVKLS